MVRITLSTRRRCRQDNLLGLTCCSQGARCVALHCHWACVDLGSFSPFHSQRIRRDQKNDPGRVQEFLHLEVTPGTVSALLVSEI